MSTFATFTVHDVTVPLTAAPTRRLRGVLSQLALSASLAGGSIASPAAVRRVSGGDFRSVAVGPPPRSRRAICSLSAGWRRGPLGGPVKLRSSATATKYSSSSVP